MRRRLARATLLVLSGAGLLVGGLGTESEAAVGFSATASAFGSRVEITVTQAPLVPNIVDAGGPTAQSSLDSLGTSRSVAALPYPGELLLSLPSLVNGLAPQAATVLQGLPGTVVGSAPFAIPDEITALLDQAGATIPYDGLTPVLAGAPPLPQYPFAAQADAQSTPQASVDLGAGRLDATASSSRSEAVAFIEPGASGARVVPVRSTSSVSVLDGRVVAEATSLSSGMSIGPVEIGAVESKAKLTLTADGTITPFTEFAVRGLRIGALSVDLTGDGFSIAGVPVPAPIAQLITQTLTGTGVELAILDEQVTETGVVSGALQIRYPISFEGLPPQIEGLGRGEMTITIGQSVATLTGAPIPDATAPQVASQELPPAIGSPDRPDPGASLSGSSAKPALDQLTAPQVAGPSQKDPAAVEPIATSAISGLPVEPFDAAGIYLVIVAGALLTAGSSELLRLLAFRPRPSTETTTRWGEL